MLCHAVRWRDHVLLMHGCGENREGVDITFWAFVCLINNKI